MESAVASCKYRGAGICNEQIAVLTSRTAERQYWTILRLSLPHCLPSFATAPWSIKQARSCNVCHVSQDVHPAFVICCTRCSPSHYNINRMKLEEHGAIWPWRCDSYGRSPRTSRHLAVECWAQSTILDTHFFSQLTSALCRIYITPSPPRNMLHSDINPNHLLPRIQLESNPQWIRHHRVPFLTPVDTARIHSPHPDQPSVSAVH